MTALTITGDIFIIAGALVFATAALGILRFPDAYTRISAVSTAGGVGIILIVTGSLLHQPSIPDTVKVILIIALQLATSAVGSMAIARSAYLTRTPLRRQRYNELAHPPPGSQDESGERAPRS